MKKFDDFPRAFKKTVRYIKQEATIEQIMAMESVFTGMISSRMEQLSGNGGARARARKKREHSPFPSTAAE
jgi:hypothetical protein